MTLIEKIRELVAEGQTERSIEELLDYVKKNDNELLDHIILLKSRMHDLNEKVYNGTIEHDDAALERARINESILKILHTITPPYLKAKEKSPQLRQPTYTRAKSKKTSTSKSWMIILGIAVVAAVVSGYFFLGQMISTGTTNFEVKLGIPGFRQDVNINNAGTLWMQIWQPGKVTGAKGSTLHIVTNFKMNGQPILARYDEISYRDPNGFVAVTTGPIYVSSNDFDLSQDTMQIPQTSFNLLPTGGQTTYTLHFFTEIWVNNVLVKSSNSQPFYLKF